MASKLANIPKIAIFNNIDVNEGRVVTPPTGRSGDTSMGSVSKDGKVSICRHE